MRRLLSGAILISISLLLLTGCPYESSIPLGDPGQAKIDHELIGKWRYEDKESKESGTVTISQFNERELLIVIYEGRNEGEALRGFVTFVGDEKILNVQEIRGAYDDRRWMFANYSVKNCTLSYRLVDDSLLKEKAKDGLSQKELNDFVKKNLANKDIYDKETTLSCIKRADAPAK